MHAAQLLAYLRNLTANQAEFIGTTAKAAKSGEHCEAFGFRRRRVVLTGGYSVQLCRDVAQRRERRSTHHHRESRRHQQRDQRDRSRGTQTGRIGIPQQRNRYSDTHFAEGRAGHGERIGSVEDPLWSVQKFHLTNKIAAVNLRERRPRLGSCADQALVTRNQHPAFMVYDRNVIDPRIRSQW